MDNNNDNNQKGLEDTEKQQMQQEIKNLQEQVGALLQLLQGRTNPNSSLDEEVTIICNMHGTLRVTFPTWSLKLSEFGERMTITKAQLQELVNNKRGFFTTKQYILLDSQHMKLAESLRIPVFDSHSNKFIKPEDLDRFATMSVYDIEQYYYNLSEPMKKTFINYFYDKCCAGETNFYNVETMNTLNRLTKSRIFDNLIASCTRNNSN